MYQFLSFSYINSYINVQKPFTENPDPQIN